MPGSSSRRPIATRMWLTLTACCVLAVSGGWIAPTCAAAGRIDEVQPWADAMWDRALANDMAQVELLLQQVPESTIEGQASRFGELQAHRLQETARLATERESDAIRVTAELDKALAENDVVKAGLKAHELKFLVGSAKWPAELKTARIQQAITMLEQQGAAAELEGDLLLAQEMNIRLRGMHENCGEDATYRKWDERFEQLSQRVSLLVEYAPRALHGLRMKSGKRADPEFEVKDFNEAFANDWKEGLNGVSTNLVRSALRFLAEDHMSATGWTPLVRGGLEAVRLLVTTPALAENFPALADPTKVAGMTRLIDQRLAELPPQGDRQPDPGYAREAIDELVKQGRTGLGIPAEVVLHQFGEGASTGLSESFGDDYTEIIWPERLRQFRQQIEGDFVGVGILIQLNDEHEIIIRSPLEGSPAARAGVRPGDEIAAVDGHSTEGWSLNDAVESITGPQGKEVALTVNRAGVEGESAFDYTMKRQKIKLRSVHGWWKERLTAQGLPEWDWFIDPAAHIGYVRLTSFNDDSFTDFMAAIREMNSQGLNGLILDLRGNPGGLLKSAVQFSNLFITDGGIVSVEDVEGNTVSRSSADPAKGSLAGLPVVVLVNSGSASASEILSGCLQAHGAAVVIGERSFGKGSVQTVQHLDNGSMPAGVKVTTQFYRLPPASGEKVGRLVHRKAGVVDWGVTPDLVVELTPEQENKAVDLRLRADSILESDAETMTMDLRPLVSDLIDRCVDPQLSLALMLLEAQAWEKQEAEAIAKAERAAPAGG